MGKEKDLRKKLVGRRNFLQIFCFLGATLILSLAINPSFSFAKDVYPAAKIKWIIPYKPGGGFDVIARAASPYMTKYLRKNAPNAKGGGIIIRNETGASGQRAYSLTYAAEPDGYTICSMDIGVAVEALFSKTDFDLGRFTYLLRPMTTTRILAAGKAGFANWEEMLKAAKAKELKWGVGSFGRSTHADSIIIKEAVGIPARFIAFGSTAENVNALMRGDVQVSLFSADSVEPMVSAKEIRPLVHLAEKSAYPGVPSIKDLGYPQLVEKLGGHRFVIAPPGLPKDIQRSLNSAFKMAFNDKEFQAWMHRGNFQLEPVYGDEADHLAKKMIKYYQEDLKQLLNLYLK